jgi:hypothetical protein
MPDFFISYNQADTNWAEWVAWELEQVGYSAVIQTWDFGPGSNFVLEMQKVVSEATQTIAVISPDYVSAEFTQPEWAAAFAEDPTGKERKLLPVRVRACELHGLLKPIVYIDLVGLEQRAARRALIDGVSRNRRPGTAPRFPAGKALERALVTAEKAFGPDDPEVATLADLLARVLSKQGNLPKAQDLTRRALDIEITSFGPNHRRVAITARDLGRILASAGDLGGAIKYARQALEIDEKAYGANHPKIAVLANELSNILHESGDASGALLYAQRALGIDENSALTKQVADNLISVRGMISEGKS